MIYTEEAYTKAMTKVLFVCTGNICRSPMAEAVFRHMVAQEGLADQIEVDSAGTGSWHVGEPPHRGTLAVLRREGIPSDGLRARVVTREDFHRFDYIVALDSGHLAELKRMQPPGSRARLRMLLDGTDVTDPYYTGGFDQVYDLVDRGCRALLAEIRREEAAS